MSGTKTAILKNKECYLELMDRHVFHYKDPETQTGFAQNAIIIKILREAFFRNKTDRGIKHKACFSPITLELLAFVLTAVEHCIEECSTGNQVKTKFEESGAAPVYDAHLQKPQDWYDINPAVVNKFLETLYKCCS